MPDPLSSLAQILALSNRSLSDELRAGRHPEDERPLMGNLAEWMRGEGTRTGAATDTEVQALEDYLAATVRGNTNESLPTDFFGDRYRRNLRPGQLSPEEFFGEWDRSRRRFLWEPEAKGEPIAALAGLLAQGQRPVSEGGSTGDPIGDRLLAQGWTVDQVRALYLWLAQRGLGHRPGPDFSPFPNPGEPDVPQWSPTEEGMYPNPVYPPGYDERGRFLKIPPPDTIPKDWTRWM